MFRREIAAIDDRVNIRFDAFLVTMNNAPIQSLFGRHVFGRVNCGVFSRLRGDIIVVFDITLQGIGAAVEEQVFRHFFFFGVDVCIRGDMRRVDDGHVHAGLDAVVEHDRIEHGSCVLRESKR